MMKRLLACGWFAMAAVAPAVAENAISERYPGFLVNRDWSSHPNERLPEKWSSTENVLWKKDMPGLAWSSPIVWDGRVYVTTAASEAAPAEPKKGLYLDQVDARLYDKPTATFVWKVHCLDLETGKTLWERVCAEEVPAYAHHIKNTLASETPVTDGERIYAYFGNVGMFCFDMDGNPQWQFRPPPMESRYSWGTSSSPVVHKGRVFIVNDNEQESYMVCLDAKTGKEIWRVARDEATNHCSPYVWENELRTEIVTSGRRKARSYDLDGNLLWEIGDMCDLAVTTPFAHDGLLYVTSGHVIARPRPIYAIRPGASGDISLKKGETSNEFVVWARPQDGPYHPTPIVHDGQMYVLYDVGILNAFDAKTGEPLYEQKKRIPNGRRFTTSPWIHGGKLFCLNEDGVTFVISTGKNFEVLYTNSLEEDDMCMASPAIVGDKLLIRTAARLYCLKEGANSEP